MNLPQILERETQFINSLKIDWEKKFKLYQMLYRSIAFDSPLYTVLHGTTIVHKGKTILFGDGVECQWKTSCGYWAADKFVADEFSLYNNASGVVYGNKYLVVSLRDEISKMIGLKEGHNFLSPKELNFEVVSSKLDMVICPKPSDRNELVEEKNFVIKMRKLAVTATAHRLKFKDNGLDRLNADGDNDTVLPEMIDDIHGYQVPEGLLKLPYFDAYLKKSKNIIKLI